MAGIINIWGCSSEVERLTVNQMVGGSIPLIPSILILDNAKIIWYNYNMQLQYKHLLTPKLIWNIEQNKPSLIAKDMQAFGVPAEITHDILLARGVYKWLSVRRNLIKLKDIWKGRITNTLEKIQATKRDRNTQELYYLRGYLKAHEECRKEVRLLCHSDRWQAPDFDRYAQEHLKNLSLKGEL